MKIDTIAKKLLFSTVRIESYAPGEESIGTGFVFAYQPSYVTEERAAFFMVTNKHVVERAEEGSFVFIEGDGIGNPKLGRGIKIPILKFKDHWHGHPDPSVDISVMPLSLLLNHVEEPDERTVSERTLVAPISSRNMANADYIGGLDAIEEVVFIGYPNGLYDKVNLTPIVRKGITATPLQMDYEGDPVFLIDASVFPGSSGSPVFAIKNFPETGGEGDPISVGQHLLFLGVVSRVFLRTEMGQIETGSIPTNRGLLFGVQQMINLGIVYKAFTVVEAIEDFAEKHGAEEI